MFTTQTGLSAETALYGVCGRCRRWFYVLSNFRSPVPVNVAGLRPAADGRVGQEVLPAGRPSLVPRVSRQLPVFPEPGHHVARGPAYTEHGDLRS